MGDVAEEARRGRAEVAGRIGELGVRARAARVGVTRDGQRLLWRPPGGGDLHVLATDGCAAAVVLGDEPATSDRDRGTCGRRAGGQHRGGGLRDLSGHRVDDRRGGLRSGPRRPGGRHDGRGGPGRSGGERGGLRGLAVGSAGAADEQGGTEQCR